MKVQQNTDVQVSNLKKQDFVSENDVVAPKEKEKKKIISVSGADLTGESLIVQRRGIARKQALKVVADAFDSELKIDTQLQTIRDTIHRLNDEKAELREETLDKVKSMMIEYGIDPDSEEGEEGMKLAREVMARPELYMEYKMPKISEDGEIILPNLSEFQEKVLNKAHDTGRKIKDIDKLQAQNVLAFAQIQSERDKSHNMQDAQKTAEDIMDASDREAIALLANEAVDHIDEEEKEREEEAKEAAEKKKEEKKKEAEKLEKEAMQQEILENIKEHAAMGEKTSADVKKAVARRERTEAAQLNTEEISEKTVISDYTSLEDAQDAVNSAVTNILNQMLLVSNDIKGSVVDDQI